MQKHASFKRQVQILIIHLNGGPLQASGMVFARLEVDKSNIGRMSVPCRTVVVLMAAFLGFSKTWNLQFRTLANAPI